MVVLLLSSCVEGVYLPEFGVFSKKEIEQEQKQEQVKKASSGEENSAVIHKKIPSEVLLDTVGRWNLVEKNQTYDPALAHLQARKKVNIKRRSKKAELSAHFKVNAKSGQDGKMRILRLEPSDSSSGGLVDTKHVYASTQSVLVKPTYMVAEKELVKKIALFLETDEAYGHGFTEDGVIIIPPDLPERKSKKRKRSYKKMLASSTVIPKLKPKSLTFVPVPDVKPKMKKAVKVAKVKKSSVIKKITKPSFVAKLRSGVHSGGTRIVIEVSHTTKYKIAIDKLRKVFRMKLENTYWDIEPQGILSGTSPLLGTYVARAQKDKSVLLEIRLRKNMKIVNTMILEPALNNSNYRVVIDLKEGR